MNLKRFLVTALGLALGLVTIPLALVLWPLACAAFFYFEHDGGEENEDDTP